METYENTVMKWIGYILFLVVIAVYAFNIGGGSAESLDTQGIVTFGSYEQDNNPENGSEPIEWFVLEQKDGKTLLVSRFGLDSLPYHDSDGDVTWEKCSLRSWLNNVFLQSAFTVDEQASIQFTMVDNSASQGNDMSISSADTQDKVFLLSYSEAFAKYFLTNESRMCAPTDYAVARGAFTSSASLTNGRPAGSWWLRSPVDTLMNALVVDFDGSQLFSNIHFCNQTVRPAVWVDTAALR